MRMRRGSGLDGLRREGSAFSALAALLLVVQLLLAGASQGAMAGERLAAPDLSVLCHVTADGSRLVTDGGPSNDGREPCPCLAGTCTPMAGLPAAASPGAARALDAAQAERPRRPAALAIDRRPLSLFARAGLSPPNA